MHSIMNKLGKEWVFFDGGTGTILQSMGLKPGELPEMWNLTHPSEVQSVCEGYLRAGCDVINANTFGLNALRFPGRVSEVAHKAICLAKQARQSCNRSDAAIALDLGPTGKLLKPMGDLAFEDAVSLYAEVVRAGTQAGADVVLIETMGDSYETKAAVLAAKETCSLPVFVTMVFDENGKMLTGGTPESMAAMLDGLRVDALGINCSLGPVQMIPVVERLLCASSLPVIVNPNAGIPRVENSVTVYDIDANAFAAAMERIARLGVHALGGCCGTTPEHIRKTISACKDIPFHPPVEKHKTVVSSFARAVEIGERPVLIGERINPTGKKKLKEALRDHNMDYILSEGIAQEDAGADLLDVNVGLPGIDEKDMLVSAVTRLQSILVSPLQIDTSDPAAMESAMRVYNGKPMINSVNGKQESLNAVFPLVAKYGGVVVALLLDEDGIPETAEKRIEIAERIYAEGSKYGIRKEDIVLDALALTVSSDSRAALTTLETLELIRSRLHGRSILGVSNISFGLPNRALINAAFFELALYSGLSCAIINPLNDSMMNAFRAYLALTDQDPQCMGFISAYGNSEQSLRVQNEQSLPMTLKESIERGMRDKAAELAQAALLSGEQDPLKLIDNELIPALNKAGTGFENGTVFLPQLLMCAEAAKAAFEAIKSTLNSGASGLRGRIILATVLGDIHDIGKNIVKVLLENYGYDVLDLGKDVPPETILDAVQKTGITLVGLSALMTTTVTNMEKTIALLHENAPHVRIVVGGAVLTQQYADEIGADCYARDVMATVRYANLVFGN